MKQISISIPVVIITPIISCIVGILIGISIPERDIGRNIGQDIGQDIERSIGEDGAPSISHVHQVHDAGLLHVAHLHNAANHARAQAAHDDRRLAL